MGFSDVLIGNKWGLTNRQGLRYYEVYR